jgi:ATP phosphoribosyltransferase-like protein
LLESGQLPRRLIVASEYSDHAALDRLEQSGASSCARTARPSVSSWDADVIIDNTATGATLEANGLAIVDVLMRSSTRLYAHRAALDDPPRRRIIEDLVLLINSVLEARRRVMLEVNASAACLDAVVAVLPSMRQATVARLFGNGGYAVKAAVPRELLPQVILAVKAAGGTDVVVSTLSQIVP